MSNPNWSEFEQRRKTASAVSSDDDFDDICARALSGLSGRELLAALRARYIERTENPLGAEAALRVRVTQQQFIRDLEAARDRGLEAIKRKAEAAAKST